MGARQADNLHAWLLWDLASQGRILLSNKYDCEEFYASFTN